MSECEWDAGDCDGKSLHCLPIKPVSLSYIIGPSPSGHLSDIDFVSLERAMFVD